jgi:hypothetical protein
MLVSAAPPTRRGASGETAGTVPLSPLPIWRLNCSGNSTLAKPRKVVCSKQLTRHRPGNSREFLVFTRGFHAGFHANDDSPAPSVGCSRGVRSSGTVPFRMKSLSRWFANSSAPRVAATLRPLSATWRSSATADVPVISQNSTLASWYSRVATSICRLRMNSMRANNRGS